MERTGMRFGVTKIGVSVGPSPIPVGIFDGIVLVRATSSFRQTRRRPGDFDDDDFRTCPRSIRKVTLDL